MQAPSVPTGNGATHGKRLIELNGGRDGPIDRGASSDLLQVSRIVGVHRFSGLMSSQQDVVAYVKENLLPLGDSVEYSMIALAAVQ